MPPLALAQQWRVISASIRGAAHVRAGLPNQDAVRVELQDGGALPAILAVSDGHGSAKCFRSHEGARLAVGVAVSVLREFAAAMSGLRPTEVHARAEQQLPREIVRRWREAVQAHVAENPIDEDGLAVIETAAAAKVREALDRNEPFLVYGATLVSVLWTGEFLVCLQLGDGEILVVTKAKQQVEQPIPPDGNLIANETTSLCEDDAWRNCRVQFQYLFNSAPALVLLATDGYPNSFAAPEGFRQVASDLLQMIEQDGADAVAQSLPGWLEEASQFGSGDDVSVAILVSPTSSHGTPPP